MGTGLKYYNRTIGWNEKKKKNVYMYIEESFWFKSIHFRNKYFILVLILYFNSKFPSSIYIFKLNLYMYTFLQIITHLNTVWDILEVYVVCGSQQPGRMAAVHFETYLAGIPWHTVCSECQVVFPQASQRHLQDRLDSCRVFHLVQDIPDKSLIIISNHDIFIYFGIYLQSHLCKVASQ